MINIWRITFDHGTVFYDNTSPSPFPSRLHLWLLALGIDVCFTRKRCPTDHAKIERTHQSMTLQALLGQRWPDSMRAAACSSSIFLAGSRPRHAILQTYPEAAHSGRFSRREWEAEMLELACVFEYRANCR